MRLRRRTVGTLVVVTGTALAGAVGVQAASAAEAKPWDFDGDGHSELVANAPSATVDGEASSGALAIFDGTAQGPTSDSGRKLDEGQSIVPGQPGADHRFGSSATSGDYNGDGFADLATCTEGTDTGGATGITVAFGSEQGLDKTVGLSNDGEQTIDCVDLETADVNKDEIDDLIKAGDNLSFVRGDSDIADEDSWMFHEIDEEPISGFFELSVGDINGDDLPDLVYATGSDSQEGRIQYGGPEGFTPGDTWQVDGQMATALGDVNGDGYDDLAFGNPGATVAGTSGAGTVSLWNGAEGGIDTSEEPSSLNQDTPEMPGTAEQDDGFGSDLALDDIDLDGNADLVVGTPSEDVRDIQDAGSYTLIPGSNNGPDASKASGVHQGNNGVPGSLEAGDRFGAQVDLRNLVAENGALEVVASAPGENESSGRVYVMQDGNVGHFSPGDANIDPSEAQLELGD